jgi:acyl carrier protein
MKTTDATVLKVVQIIVDKLAVNENMLTYKTSFKDDLGADSLDIFELLMAVEKEFKFKMKEEETEKIATVGALIECVNSRQPQATQHQDEHASVIIDTILKEAVSSKNLLQSSN